MPFVLSRALRLRRSRDIEYVLRKGEKRNCALFTVRLLPQDPARTTRYPARVTVIVSKKIAHDAVPRNRIKRRLAEALRLMHSQLPSGIRIAVIARDPCIARLPFPKLIEELSKLCL